MSSPADRETQNPEILEIAALLNDGSPSDMEALRTVQDRLERRQFGQYEIAVLNAIPREKAAVNATFGQYRYVPSRIGRATIDVATVVKRNGDHEPVVVARTAGQGLVQTAAATASLCHQLPYLKSIILIGIAAGQPNLNKDEDDVWLGDIVVADTVVQYDHVKRESSSKISCRGEKLNTPDTKLLAVARDLVAEMEQPAGSWTWEREIDGAVAGSPKFVRPTQARDPNMPLRAYQVPAMHRASDERPQVKIGAIGSANTLLKDAAYRDKLHGSYKTVAYEMEGAGLAITADAFGVGYLIVRGICDYGDSRKNDDWQHYATIAAAAFTKALIAIR